MSNADTCLLLAERLKRIMALIQTQTDFEIVRLLRLEADYVSGLVEYHQTNGKRPELFHFV